MRRFLISLLFGAHLVVRVVTAAGPATQNVPFVDYLHRWLGGEIQQCDLEYVHYYDRSSNVVSAVADLLKRSGRSDIVLQPETGVCAVEVSLHMRRDAALVVQRTILSPDRVREGVVEAVGWCSNALWRASAATTQTTFVTVDCDKGAKYGTASAALRDVSGDLGAVASWPLQVMACGLPGNVRELQWNDRDFASAFRSDGAGALHGRLVAQSDNHFDLEYRYGGVSLSDTNGTRQVVSLWLAAKDQAFPAMVRIGDGGEAQVFSNIVFRTGSAVKDDVAFAVMDFVKSHPSVALVTVISNGWQYAAYSGGRWIQSPNMIRVNGDAGSTWSVRILLVVLLVTPLLVAAGRRVYRR
jgi:hypothetical protein